MSQEPKIQESFFTTSGGARILYREVSPAGGQTTVPLLCLHGFVRNSRDFVELGRALASTGTRLIAPDLRGRGFSPRYTDVADYHYDRLVQDTWDLMDHLGVQRFAMLGIALGGMMCMTMAAQAPQRVRGIVLNDLGAEIAEAGVKSSGSYADNDGYTFDEAVARMKGQFREAYPDLPESRWPELMLRAYREIAPGRYERDFDMLSLVDGARMRKEFTSEQLWPHFLATGQTPVALLRGEHSDFLAPEVADAMVNRHPSTVLTTVKGRGHPPLLEEADALAAVRALLVRASADA